jgi:hypothetical protein
MKLKTICATFLLLNFNVTAHAAGTSYLCIPDMATGFKLENGKWDFARFDVSKDKYLVQQEFEAESYKVVEIGSANPNHTGCLFSGSTMVCGDLYMGFIFNSDVLRYQRTYGFGYVNGDSVDNTPLVEIGRCSKI